MGADPKAESQTPRSRLRTSIAGLLTLAWLALLLLSAGNPMSPLFWGGLFVLFCVALGAWIPRGARWAFLVGILTSATLVIGVLVGSGPQGETFMRETTIPGGQPLPRWTSLVPERDAAFVAAPFVATDSERVGLVSALDAIYAEAEADVLFRRTTQLRTLLDGQTADRSDAHFHRTGSGDKWVVFLHGLGGNALSGCWVVAKAAAAAGWSTLCPSTEFSGHWWSGDGPTLVNASVSFAREQGAERLVLAGYSNGASGALHVLDAGANAFEALILISGFNRNVEAESIDVPTLVISGDEDVRCSAASLELWSARLSAAHVLIAPGDHMMLVKRRRFVAGAITEFLGAMASF